MRTLLFGAHAESLEREIHRHESLTLVDDAPDVVISYGGDGTLLAAERQWPGVPKLPIRNSRRGVRTIHHPPAEVIGSLARGELTPMAFIKVECTLRHNGDADSHTMVAMNEFNVHMGHVNSAVRFKMWLNGTPYANGLELIGDGLVVSTPFGSTAYYNHITRGIFYEGLGVAFKYVAEHTTHMVVPESTLVRVNITRGPAVLAYDSAPEYLQLEEGAELLIRKADQPAVVLTWADRLCHPSESF